MLKKYWMTTTAEICLIIAISATAGVVWNRTLLTAVWRGEALQTGQAQISQPAQLPRQAPETEKAKQTEAKQTGPKQAEALQTQGRQAEQTRRPENAPSTPPADATPMPIGLMQVKELHEAREAVLVDARNRASFAQGHIPGALMLPVEQARKESKLPGAEVPKDATLIVYCNGFSCHDSMEVGKLLMQAGYASVYVYEGGYPEWRDSGYPIAKGER